jgi:hypothetical protein
MSPALRPVRAIMDKLDPKPEPQPLPASRVRVEPSWRMARKRRTVPNSLALCDDVRNPRSTVAFMWHAVSPDCMQTRKKLIRCRASPRPISANLWLLEGKGGRFAVGQRGSARILTIAAKTQLAWPPSTLNP